MIFGIVTISIGVLILGILTRFALYGLKPDDRLEHYIGISMILFSVSMITVGSFSIFISYKDYNDNVSSYVTHNDETIAITTTSLD